MAQVRRAGNGFETMERIWVNSDRSKAVPEGSTAAAFLLAGPGEVLPVATVERLALTIDGERAKPKAPGAVTLPPGPDGTPEVPAGADNDTTTTTEPGGQEAGL